MRAFILVSLAVICLASCAAVFTDASDANQVTYLNSSGESIEQLAVNARSYCAQFGKAAVYRNSDTQFVAVFDCKMQR
jgi:hypothetical protein